MRSRGMRLSSPGFASSFISKLSDFNLDQRPKAGMFDSEGSFGQHPLARQSFSLRGGEIILEDIDRKHDTIHNG